MKCNCPVVYFKTVSECGNTLSLESNFGGKNKDNESLEIARERYGEDTNVEVLYLAINDNDPDDNGLCVGLTIEQARELAMSLNSMCDYIEGKSS